MRPARADGRALLASRQSRQALRRLRRARRHRPRRCSRASALGLIGPNGSGKSTLVNCICGTLQNETGSVHFDGQAARRPAAHQRTRRGLARSFQLPRPFASLTLADNLRIPLLYTRRTARGRRMLALDGEIDDALRRAAAPGRPRRQGAPAAARPDPGRDAQARARARHGGRAEAPDRRRGDGRPVAFRGRGHPRRC